MLDPKTFNIIVMSWTVLGLAVLPILFFIKAPYGRHIKKEWKPVINNRLGWFIMELPSVVFFAYFFLTGSSDKNMVLWLIFTLWELHYINRVFVFPLKLKTKGKKMPLAIAIFALFFNFGNGFINGYFFGNLALSYDLSWFYDPRFIIGIILFITGMIINWQSDEILFKLRKPGETGYKIPYGKMYKYISCPNYFGEIMEWTGFAILTWCLPSLSFLIWTLVNLMPRAISNHKWYRENFNEYPSERKAFIPFIL